MKGLESIIHDCDRRLMELRHRVDAEAERERARLRELRDKTVAQLKKALTDLGLPVNGNGNGNGGEAPAP